MASISSSSGSVPFVDRATQVQRIAEFERHRELNGAKPKTTEEISAELEEADRSRLQTAEGYEKLLKGETTYLGSSIGNRAVWDPDGYKQTIADANQARSKPYVNMPGPVIIQPIDVSAAVTAQSKITGSDLKTLSTYGDYLRGELSAASSVRDDVSFFGTWGRGRSTTDVDEYISWLFKAAQEKSQ